jgi:hypothetical protein
VEGIYGISRDYPLKTRTSKQPIGEISGFEIISSYPLKYPKSKQGLKNDMGSTSKERKKITMAPLSSNI